MRTLVLLAAALVLAGCNAYAAGDMRAFASPFEGSR
jgi:hypothetical protein